MQKKWISYSLIAIIISAFVWTVYSNFSQTKNSSNQSIAIGSRDIEVAQETDTGSAIINEHQDPEEHAHELNEDPHIDEHEHEHEHEHDESSIDSHSDHDGHVHEINTTEVMDVSTPAPQFITKTLEGETIRLSDFLGKRVILNVWTTWCPPCQEEIPELQKFHETSAKKHNVVLLGLNITNEDLGIDVIRDFKEYYGITYPILLDETGEITGQYEVITIPTTYIVDEKGNFEKQILGPVTDKMLNDLLTE